MWLTKDARHLLIGYYVNIFNIDDRNVCGHLDKPKWFEMPDWTTILAEPNWQSENSSLCKSMNTAIAWQESA